MGTAGSAAHREPWNKGKLVGQKSPFKLNDIWALRARLQMEGRVRELALFNLGIELGHSKLDYRQSRPMSRGAGNHLAASARDAEHRPEGYNPFRNASSLSSGRYRPGLPVGGVVRSRTRCFKSRSASRYI